MGLGAGQIALDIDLTALISKTYQKPIGRAVGSANQAVPITANTPMLLGAEDYDTHGFHSTSVNTSRITPTIPGYYKFTAVAFMGAPTGTPVQQVCWRKNATTNIPAAWRQTTDASASTNWGPMVITQPMNGTTDFMEFVFTLAVAQSTAVSVQFTSFAEWEFIRDL